MVSKLLLFLLVTLLACAAGQYNWVEQETCDDDENPENIISSVGCIQVASGYQFFSCNDDGSITFNSECTSDCSFCDTNNNYDSDTCEDDGFQYTCYDDFPDTDEDNVVAGFYPDEDDCDDENPGTQYIEFISGECIGADDGSSIQYGCDDDDDPYLTSYTSDDCSGSGTQKDLSDCVDNFGFTCGTPDWL